VRYCQRQKGLFQRTIGVGKELEWQPTIPTPNGKVKHPKKNPTGRRGEARGQGEEGKILRE